MTRHRRCFRARTIIGVIPTLIVLSLALAMAAGRPELASAQTNVRLYGVTGDGAFVPETLYRLSLADGSPTFVMTLGNGDDGEALAFNPDDGLMYHASGHATDCVGGDVTDCNIFESIDLDALTVTNIDISGNALSDEEGQAMTYWRDQGVFLYTQNHFTPQEFYRVTTAGVPTNIGQLDHQAKGIAFNLAETVLYTVDARSVFLRTVDPLTGATLTEIAMSAPFGFSGANGLATHPVTGQLYGLFRGGGEGEGDAGDDPLSSLDLSTHLNGHDADGDKLAAPDQAPRTLGIIDPATGVVSPVGSTGDSFAGIAFAFDPLVDRAVGGFEVGRLEARSDLPQAVSSAGAEGAGGVDGGRALLATIAALAFVAAGAAVVMGRRARRSTVSRP